MCTGQCPVPRLARRRTRRSREKVEGAAAKIHRNVRCAPDYPVSQQRPSQRLATRSANNTWPTITWLHRTVSDVPSGPRDQRSASLEKERYRALFMSGGASDCPVHQLA
jgi:hypothetical protein